MRGPCRENLHYLWKRAVRIAGKPHDNYRSCNYPGVSPQFLQPFSIDSADFPCRDPAIPSPCSFHGAKICSVHSLTYSDPFLGLCPNTQYKHGHLGFWFQIKAKLSHTCNLLLYLDLSFVSLALQLVLQKSCSAQPYVSPLFDS